MDQESTTQTLARIAREALAAAERMGPAEPIEKATAVIGTGAGMAGIAALTLLLASGPSTAAGICGRCG